MLERERINAAVRFINSRQDLQGVALAREVGGFAGRKPMNPLARLSADLRRRATKLDRESRRALRGRRGEGAARQLVLRDLESILQTVAATAGWLRETAKTTQSELG